MIESPVTCPAPAVSPFNSLREQIPLLQEIAYFQTGSLAPLSETVRNAAVLALETEGNSALAGPNAYGEFHQQREGDRARLAAFLGVRPSEIGWTSSTTSAIRHAIGTVPWRAGDTLITTNREHISTRSLQEGLRQQRDVATAVLDASEGDDRLLSELEQALRNRQTTRLVLISQVSCQDGRQLPVEAAVRLAHAYDVPVLVDAAQSLGQLPIDVRALECDMLVGSSHKWLLGPAGLGFLYIAGNGLISFQPSFAMTPPAPDANAPVAAGIELGTASTGARAGLAAAIDLIDTIGLPQIQRHVSRLTEQFRSELALLPNISILSPTDPDRSSGIISFTINGYDHARLATIVSELWELDRIMAKVQIEHPSIRTSIAAFNNEDDVSRLIRAIRLTSAILHA